MADIITNGSFTGSATSWTLSGFAYNTNNVKCTSLGASSVVQDLSAIPLNAGQQYQLQYTIASWTPTTGSELVTNGSFSVASGWAGSGWSYGAGNVIIGNGGILKQTISITPGTVYQVKFTVQDGQVLTPSLGGTSGTPVTGTGTPTIITQIITAGSGNSDISFSYAGIFANMFVDDVSVKTVTFGSVTPHVGGTAGIVRSGNGTFSETIVAGSSDFDLSLDSLGAQDFTIDDVSLSTLQDLELVNSVETRMPVYSPITFVVRSTQTDRENFKYVADIFVSKDSYDGSLGTFSKVATLKREPDPNDNGIFPVHRILENYVTHDVKIEAGPYPTNCPHTHVWYRVEFGVEYSPTVGADPVLYRDLDRFTGMTWNGAMQYERYYHWGLGYDVKDQFFMGSGSGKSTGAQFLTDMPSQVNTVYNNQWDKLGIGLGKDTAFQLFQMNYIGSAPQYNIITFDKGHNFLDSGTFAAYGDPAAPGDDIVSVPAGPWHLNQRLSAGDWITPPAGLGSPIIDSTVDHYLLYASDPSGSPSGYVSSWYWFRVRDCAREYAGDEPNVINSGVGQVKKLFDGDYRPVTLTWLNQWGGFDTFTFRGRNLRTTTPKFTQYDRLYGRSSGQIGLRWGWQLGGDAQTPGKYEGADRGRTTLSVTASDSYSLNTGFITQDEASYLESLFLSSQVYMAVPQTTENNPIWDGGNVTIYPPPTIINWETVPYIPHGDIYEWKQDDSRQLISYSFNVDCAINKSIGRG